MAIIQKTIPHIFRNKYLTNNPGGAAYIGGTSGGISHTHENKEVIDAITFEDVNSWNNKLDKAIWDNAFIIDETNNLRVKLNLVGEQEVSAYGAGSTGGGVVTIVDNLTSTAIDCALSANQGRVLKGLIDNSTSGVSSWNDLLDKPSTFTPSTHVHTVADITNLSTLLDDKAAVAHTHTIANITDLQTKLDAKADTSTVTAHIDDTTKHITEKERTNWNAAYTNNHTHSNKTVIDGITTVLTTNWNAAHTHTTDTTKHITAEERTNWNGVVSDWNKAFYFDDSNNLRVKLNLVGEQEVSAYGAGSTGGSGVFTIVDNLTSTAIDCALSANQGRVLKDLIDNSTGGVSSWNDLLDKPASFTPSAHVHTIADVTNLSTLLDGKAAASHTHNYTSTVKLGTVSYSVASNTISLPAYPTTLPASDVSAWAKAASKPTYSWNEIGSKPSTFTPAAHTHTIANITDLQTTLDGKADTATVTAHIDDTTKHITEKERTNWNAAYTNNHTHSNKSVIDGITSTKITNWDGVVTSWNKAFYFDNSNNLRVKLNLVGEGEVSAYGAGSTGGSGVVTIVDNLTSTAIDCALSANQGRVLKGLIDGKISSVAWSDITGKPTTFAPDTHIHTIANITSLQTALDGKAATLHTHNYTSIIKVGATSYSVSANTVSLPAYPTTLPASDVSAWAKASTKPTYAWNEIGSKPSTFTPAAHTHVIANITSLQTALDGKAATSHTHNYTSTIKVGATSYSVSANTVSLPAYPTTLPASDVSAWAKASTKPTYTWSEIGSKPATFTPAAHTHAISGITSLQTALDGKAANSALTTHVSDTTKHITVAERTKWNAKLDKSVWDKAFTIDANNNLKVKLNLIGEGEVSAYGSGTTGGGGAITIVDNLTTTSIDAALSANQGRVLKGLIDGKISSVAWNDITSKPSTFTPAAHTHTIANITSLQTALDGKAATSHTHNYTSTVKVGSTAYAVSANTISLPAYPTTLPASDVSAWAKAATKPTYAWSEISSKPTTFTPATHTHNYAGSSSVAGAATSANKVNSTLSFAAGAFAAKSFNGSAATTVNVPTHTSHLTNNSGYITTAATVAAANKLSTARTINGTSFDGTANITTANWGNARTLSLAGNASGSISINGGSNVSLTVSNNYAANCDTVDGKHNGDLTANYYKAGSQQTLNLSALNANTWYPCVMTAYPSNSTPIRVTFLNALSGNKPTWATHSSGFSFQYDFEWIGGGWGAIEWYLRNYRYAASFGGETCCYGIEQRNNRSSLVIYLRGGAYYNYRTTDGRAFKVYTATTNIGDAQYPDNVSPRTTKLNDCYRQESGSRIGSSYISSLSDSATKLSTARTINGTSFDGTANITTANWGNARTLSLAGNASGSVSINGGSNVTLTVSNNYASSAGNAASANKVNSTLSLAAGAFAAKSFNGSAATTVNIPTHTSHITNNSGYITTSATVAAANKLSTARTINGTSFNGTANITTANWGNARTLTLAGNASGSISINGGSNVSLTVSNNYATNCDTVDNLHATAFTRADQSPTVDLDTVNGKGIMTNAANAYATTARHYPIAEAGTLFYGTAAYSSANQIYGSFNQNRWFARGGGGSPTTKTSWKEFAFKTDNVASATKLQTPRAINGTNFDGSAAITTATWGTARSIYIQDATATNTSTAVVVNGGANVNLKLPTNLKVGNLVATGEVTAYSSSDIRLKKDIKSINNSLEILDKLSPVQFKWNKKAKDLNTAKDNRNNYGLIAQEVEEVLPELIHPIYEDYKSVDYEQLIPILIGAIKELKDEIDFIKNNNTKTNTKEIWHYRQ